MRRIQPSEEKNILIGNENTALNMKAQELSKQPISSFREDFNQSLQGSITEFVSFPLKESEKKTITGQIFYELLLFEYEIAFGQGRGLANRACE